MINDPNTANRIRTASRLRTAAALLGACAAAHVAAAGVVHALRSPDGPSAMAPGSVLMTSVAEARSGASDFHCTD